MKARCVELLREAMDLPEAQRRGFVEQASTGDAALRTNLLRLLELDVAADPFLDSTLDSVVADLLSSDEDLEDALDYVAPGDRVGPWRIISKLGAGGMGSVWLAERADGEYTQKVALKTIKLGMDSAMVLAQFRRERNVLARLTHPNIASLIDGGMDDLGRPWFAMDYVEGADFRDWIRTQPPLRERLRLFGKLCHAVAHAHQQLVIHRDIKPGNVLVQANGEPKLLDFGIAKLLEEEDGAPSMTVHRFVSRRYAAPEQLRGEAATTATDVYTLGALLFELLTGECYTRVHESDTGPTRPSQVRGGQSVEAAVPSTMLRGDLDAIVTRALADEPSRRYATVLSLAADIQNYLDGRPITARPDSFTYRANKFIRRNRATVAVALFGLLSLLVASGAALWQAHAKTEEAARTQVALKRSEAIRGFIESVFLDADPSRAQGADTTAGELLDAARKRVAKDLGDQPDIAATLLNQIGSTYVSLGKDAQAREVLKEALAMNARSSHPSLAVEASAAGRLAHYDYLDGHADLALAELDRIISRLRVHADLPVELSNALQFKGSVLSAVDRSPEGLAAQAEAVAVLAPHANEFAAEYAWMLIGYADSAAGNHKGAAALQATERALALPLLQQHPPPGLELAALGAKVRALQALGRDAEAESTLPAVIEASSSLFGANNGRTRYWVYRQGQVLQKLGRLDEAQVILDGLLTQPASGYEQPIARAAYSVVAADIAVARRAADAGKRKADAVSIACGKNGNSHFCEKARSLAVPVD